MALVQSIVAGRPAQDQRVHLFLDASGQLRTVDSGYVLGYQADGHGRLSHRVGRLSIPLGAEYAFRPTTRIELGGNLNPEDGEDVITSVTAVDGDGSPRTLWVRVSPKLSAGPGSRWEVRVRLNDVNGEVVGKGEVAYDEVGRAQDGARVSIHIPAWRGHASHEAHLVFANTTALADCTARLVAANQNGVEYGKMFTFEIHDDGTLVGRFDNGISRALGQIILLNPFYSDHADRAGVYPQTFSTRLLIQNGEPCPVLD